MIPSIRKWEREIFETKGKISREELEGLLGEMDVEIPLNDGNSSPRQENDKQRNRDEDSKKPMKGLPIQNRIQSSKHTTITKENKSNNNTISKQVHDIRKPK